MQRKLPLLLALLVSAGALADVTVYGQANAGLVLHKANGTTKTKIDNLYTPSRLGFRGTEDLGDGLKASFQLEQQVNIDTGDGMNFGQREAWVALSGGFGKLGLGRGKTPYTNTADYFEIFDGSSLGLAIYGVDSVTNAGALGATASAGGARFHNSVRYDSNNLDGFTAAVQLGVGENETDTVKETRALSLNARYNFGQFGVFGAYSSISDAGGVAGADKTALLLGGAAKFDALTVQLGWQRGELDANQSERDSVISTLAYAVGPTTYKAGILLAGEQDLAGSSVANSDYRLMALGVKHALSKRTNLVAEYARKDADGSANDQTALTLAVMHAF